MISAALIFLVARPGGSAQSLPTVAQILARSKKLYESCHTYQGTLTFTVTQSGKPYSQVIDIKCDVGPKGMVKRTLVSISADKTPEGAGPMRARAVDDGTNAYTINDSEKSYGKQTHVEESIFSMLSFVNQLSDSDGAKVSLGGSKLDPVYIITKSSHGSNLTLQISQQTGQFLEMHGARGGPGKADTLKVALNHQRFNATIPAETFSWTPPKDYKETKGGG